MIVNYIFIIILIELYNHIFINTLVKIMISEISLVGKLLQSGAHKDFFKLI